jgi:hypothetical protein
MKEFLYDVILPITATLVLISGAVLITAIAFVVIKDIFKK